MVTFEHIERFITERPRQFSGRLKKKLLREARKASGNNEYPIGASQAEVILGRSNARKLFSLITRDPAYIAICFKRTLPAIEVNVIVPRGSLGPSGDPRNN